MTNLRTHPVLFSALSLGGLLIVLWQCQYGVDLSDESLLYLGSWKLYPSGGKFFVDEISNGLRNFDLLNYLFIRPLIPFSLLKIRMSAALVYFLLLLLLTWISFRGKLGFLAALTFASCYLYDTNSLPGWSYNWWPRNALLLHHSLLLLGARSENTRKKNWFCGGAGFSLGVGIISNYTIAPAFLLGGIALLLFEKSKQPFENLFPYCLGGLLSALPLGIFLGQTEIRQAWLTSIHSLLHRNVFSGGHGTGKILFLLSYIAHQEIFWLFWILIGLTTMAFASPLLKRSTALLAALVGFRIVILTIRLDNPQTFFHFYRVLGLACALFLILFGIRKREAVFCALGSSTLVYSLCMGISSSNDTGALYWVLPTAYIPAVAILEGDSREKLPLQIILGIALVLLSYFSLKNRFRQTYYDVPPLYATTKLSLPPLEGLHTSSRKALLIEHLVKTLKGKRYVLAYPMLAGVYLFNNIAAAANTSLILPSENRKDLLGFLGWMREQGRIPEAIVWARVDPGKWGLSQEPQQMLNGEVYFNFQRCAGERILAEFPEYVVYSTSKTRTERCIDLAFLKTYVPSDEN